MSAGLVRRVVDTFQRYRDTLGALTREWRNGRRDGFRCHCPMGVGVRIPPRALISQHLGAGYRAHTTALRINDFDDCRSQPVPMSAWPNQPVGSRSWTCTWLIGPAATVIRT